MWIGRRPHQVQSFLFHEAYLENQTEGESEEERRGL